MDLSRENVQAIFLDSLAPEGEAGPLFRVRGLINEYTLHLPRLQGHRDAVRSFLGHVSTLFYADRGGGHSCLHLQMRRDGFKWGDQHDMERLLVLGLGLGLIGYCFQRQLWDLFPRSVPYVTLESDLFKLWAVFRRSSTADPGDGSQGVFTLSFDAEGYPPPPPVGDELERRKGEAKWYRPAVFRIFEISTEPAHVAEAFYNSIIVDGFFNDSLPSWVLDPRTTLQVY